MITSQKLTIGRFYLACLVTCLFVLSGLVVRAQTMSAGVIEGRVNSANNGRALANVRVVLEGTNHETLTDESGAYRFAGVSQGPAQIGVFHVGMDKQVATVTVPAGGTVQRDFELVLHGSYLKRLDENVIQLEKLTVVADREMSAQAIAMNERRYAPNIKNVVAIDEFGDRGNENIGEFLLFLPGVSIVTGGIEPEAVSLRGFPSNNTNLAIDGGSVASSFNASNRTVDLRGVPMNNIARVEITKVPTPDMPASGLGGSINLITRSGFESKRPQFKYSLYTISHNADGLTLDGGPKNHVVETSPKHKEPSFDFSYLYPVNKSLSFTVSGTRTWRQKGIDSGGESDESTTYDHIKGVQTVSQLNNLAQVTKTYSGQIGVDWRISSKDTLSASFQYRDYSLYTTRSVFGVRYGTGATGDGTFTQGTSTGVGSAYMGDTGTNGGTLTITNHLALKYRHIGDTWRIDAAGSLSGSKDTRPDINNGHFYIQTGTITNLIVRGEGIPGGADGYIPRVYTATTRTGVPVDLLDGANYSLNTATSNQADRAEDRMGFQVNATRDLGWTIPMTLKLGVAIDRTERDQTLYPRTWNFRPNGATDVTSRLAGKFDVFDDEFNATGPTVFGQAVRWISPRKFYDLYQSHPDWFVEDEALTWQNYANNSSEITETVSAGYLRSDLRLLNRRLWIATGVRFEQTDVKGRGVLDDIDAQYQRDASGNFMFNSNGGKILVTTDALALSKLRYKERGMSSKRRYSDFYPSLNATYNLTEHLVLRAAYARTIGRPNLNNIIPGAVISAADAAAPRITVNNTGLQPWTADNFDVSLESYQFKDGFGSIGVFQKDITNFFSSITFPATTELLAQYGLDDTYLNYDIVTQYNVGDAKVRGVEFSYRQSLTFLPHWARGLQVFGNLTKLEVSGSNEANFSGFNPTTLAAGINLIRPRYFVKLTWNYSGEVRGGAVASSATIAPDTYNYQGARTRWGINAQYALNKHLAFYFLMTDIGGFTNETLRYSPITPEYAKGFRLQNMGYYTTIGVRGTF